MKNITLITLLILSILACQEKKPKQTYYRINKNGKILTKEQYQKELKRREKSVSEYLGKTTVVEERIDSIVSNDSIILTFKTNFVMEGIEVPPSFKFLNKKLPSIPLRILDGGLIDLSKTGKPMVLNFWGVVCKPCIREMPDLNEIKEKYQDKLDFYAIAYNRKEEVIKFLEKYNFTFTHIVEAGEFKGKIGVNAIPKTLFIDKNGIVVAAIGGLSYKNEESEVDSSSLKEFEHLIKKILE